MSSNCLVVMGTVFVVKYRSTCLRKSEMSIMVGPRFLSAGLMMILGFCLRLFSAFLRFLVMFGFGIEVGIFSDCNFGKNCLRKYSVARSADSGWKLGFLFWRNRWLLLLVSSGRIVEKK